MSENKDNLTYRIKDSFLLAPIRMVFIIMSTIGFVLLVIGTNIPSTIISGLGISILVVIMALWVIKFRHKNEINTQESKIENNKLVDDYKKDLKDTLDGYDLQGKYNDNDINQSTKNYLSSLGKVNDNH